MTESLPQTFAEYAFVTRTKADFVAFSHLLAASINPEIFENQEHLENIIKISTHGNQRAGKSLLADEAAIYILPQHAQNNRLLFQGNEDIGRIPSTLEGPSPLYGGKEITLSYEEADPHSLFHRANKPGIHFEENVRLSETINPWLLIDIKSAEPEDPEEYSMTLEDIEVDLEDPPRYADEAFFDRTREYESMFSYVSDDFLARYGLNDVFKQAVDQDADMPRVFSVRVFKDRLMNDPAFAKMIDFLQQAEQTPEQTSELLAAYG